MSDAASLKERITEDMKSAMRAGDKSRLGAVRLILAAIKQLEVDQRVTLSDAQCFAVLEKMLKQRRDSLSQFEAAGRQELAAQESFEIDLIQGYLPTQLSEAELIKIIDQAVATTNAKDIKDMGKVMGAIKSQLQGRADMSAVSAIIKSRLSIS